MSIRNVLLATGTTGGGGGEGPHVCLFTGLSFQGQYKLKCFFHFVRLSKMSFSLLERLDKDLDLCGAISYEKSVGGEMCVYQKCPFCCWYNVEKYEKSLSADSCIYQKKSFLLLVQLRKYEKSMGRLVR